MDTQKAGARSSGVAAIDRVFTRREFMTYVELIEKRQPSRAAVESVALWERRHPEVDMDERLTWAEWQAQADQPAG